MSRKVDNNVPGPVNSHLVRDASSSCTVCDSRVFRSRPIAAEPEISTNKRVTYLDDKQDNGILHVIFAGIGSLQNASLGSGTEGWGRGRGC